MEFQLIRGNAEWSTLPVVADGCMFPDGRAVLAWRGEHRSIAIYPTLMDLYVVHCHQHNRAVNDPEPKELSALVSLDRTMEISLDPWHAEAFKGTPVEGAFRTGATRQLVWMQLDGYGNAIGTGGPVESCKLP